MDRLPVKILEIILGKILQENPEELFRLRAVSHTWKSAAERSGSEVFKYWYNRCKTEIPQDHLADIVQGKYPLVAHPWQEFYWVDRRLAHVAKHAYCIWNNFPKINDEIDATKINYDWPLESFADFPIGINAKYYGGIVRDEQTRSWVTRIYQWNNKDYLREFDIQSNEIDFYTTEKGTFVVLSFYNKTGEIHISKHPIDNLDLPSELISLGREEYYCITQNEYFSITHNYSTHSRVIVHKILTERGFETSTVIKAMPQLSWGWVRVEISRCTLYVVQRDNEKLGIVKYKISRSSSGKLLFTLEEWKLLDENERKNSALYSQIYNLSDCNIYSNNLCLTDHTFATEKFNSWLEDAFNQKIRALAVYANYVICEEQKPRKTQICMFQKDNLIESMKANNPDHLKPVFKDNFPFQTEFTWIGVIYNGLKAQLLVHYYEEKLCRMNFY